MLSRYGGIRPRIRCRSARVLTGAEREEISRGIASGQSLRLIARILNRSPSTLGREVRRNGGRTRYRAAEADKQAWKRARRRKRCRLVCRPQLCQMVEEKLREAWAPQQITGWLKRTYPGDEFYQVSHETIYRSLFIQARGAFKKELTRYLRSKRTIRRSRHATRKGRGGGQIQDLISIRERPATVEDRAVPGHWEGDRLAGSNNSHIVTLVERHSRYVMLAKVAGKDTATADLGPGSGDGGPQTLHAGDRHRCLLLRSQEPLATRIEREYEWVVAAVLPQENRFIRTLTRASRRGRSAAQQTATSDARV